MGNKAVAATKSEITKRESRAKTYEIMKGNKFGDKAITATKNEIIKENKFGREAGSGNQERNYEGRQAWEITRQPRAKL